MPNKRYTPKLGKIHEHHAKICKTRHKISEFTHHHIEASVLFYYLREFLHRNSYLKEFLLSYRLFIVLVHLPKHKKSTDSCDSGS
jgi:hypothetical protein